MTTTVLRFVGGTGSGKTTALRAFADERNAAGVKCLIVSGASTVNGVLQELDQAKYNAVLIDANAEHPGEAEWIAERLLNHDTGLDHIVIACDRHPAEDQRDDLLLALEGLVKINEEHNASVAEVIGKPANWKGGYLDTAREAIACAKLGKYAGYPSAAPATDGPQPWTTAARHKHLRIEVQSVTEQRDQLAKVAQGILDKLDHPTECVNFLDAEKLRAAIGKATPEVETAQAWAWRIWSARRYTSISKGGSYEKLGVIRGAGKLKGFAGIGYRDPVTGDIFIREPECFASRMQLVKVGGAQ